MKKITHSFLILFFFLSVSIFAQMSDSLVISQVYGGGGNTGAPYTNDFIELFNPTSVPIDLTGWSVQYASAAGSSWTNITALSGIVAPGAYWLVQEAGGTNGSPLPTADVIGTIAMSATAGKVALCNSVTALTTACPTGGAIIDFVGYGTTANCFEGTGPSPAPSNTNAILRADTGCTDANNNSADFSAAAPAPRNSASPLHACTPTFIYENTLENSSGLIVFPNPVYDVLYVGNNFSGSKIVSVTIFNAFGKKVYENNSDAGHANRIDVSGFASGIYFIRINGGNNLQHKKFIKK